MEDKKYTLEEINKLDDKYRLSKRTILIILVTIVLSLIGALMVSLGITFLVLNGTDEMVILITFGGMVFALGLCLPIFIKTDKSKDQALKKQLIIQAIQDSFNGRVVYDSKTSVNSKILRETDICPFDVIKSGEKILLTHNNQNVSILEVTSSSNLEELLAFIMAAPELGVIGTAFVGIFGAIQKISDKSIINKKFKGTIMVFPNIKKSSNTSVEVRSKKFITPLSSKYGAKDKFETEGIKVNESFNFYSSDVNEGFKMVTPLMIETINTLNEKLKKGFVLIFKDDYITLGLSEYEINIENILKNKNITAKTGYFKTLEILSTYKYIIELITKNRYKY